MDLKRSLALLVLSIIVLSGATGQSSDDSFEFSVQSTDVDVGSYVEARVETPDHLNESSLNYIFELDEKYNRSSPVFEHRLESAGRKTISVTVYGANGDRLFHDGESFQVQSDKNVEIQIEPSKVEPGEEIQAKALVEGEVKENYSYRWSDSDLTFENLYEKEGPTLKFETFSRSRSDNPMIEVRVTRDDGVLIGSASRKIEWNIPNVDIEGMNIDYNSNSIEAEISEDELREGPEFRAGTSIDAWNQISLNDREGVGGVKLELEDLDVENFEDDNDLIPYSVVEVSGDNIEDLNLRISSDIPKKWLYEKDLLISSREADISYYIIQDGEWNMIDSEPGHSTVEGHVGLDIERSSYDQETILSSNSQKIAIAGDPEGIDFGKYALTAQGGCEELEEGEPVPAGWEELDITCSTHSELERVEEEFEQRLTHINKTRYREEISEVRERIDDRLPGPAQIELENLIKKIDAQEMREELDEIKNQLDSLEERGIDVERFRNRTKDLEGDIESLEEGEADRDSRREIQSGIGELRRNIGENREMMDRIESRPGGEPGETGPDERRLSEESVRAQLEVVKSMEERVFNRLPEELEGFENLYEPPEDIESRYNEVEQMIDNGELDSAQDEVEAIRKSKQDSGLENISTAERTYETIESLRENEALEDEDIEKLDNAEDILLNERNVTRAEKMVQDVERSIQIDRMREVVNRLLKDEEIRQMVRDIISEVIPGLG